MGNQICCEEVNNSKEDKIIIYVGQSEADSPTKTNMKPVEGSQLKPPEKLQISEPQLSPQVKLNLQKYRPFHELLNNYSGLTKIKSALYKGPVNQSGKPEGYGKMFFSNGSVLVGKFVNGVPNGPAHYVWPDGSFYKGQVLNSKASDNLGIYECEEFIYQGSIKDNNFEGEGTMKAKDQSYQFSGIFENGKRKYGKLTWKQADKATLPLSSSQVQYDVEYTYEGNFDENEEFTGKGTLTGPKGVYTGQFARGMRNGQGVFQYLSGLRYEGTYKDNERHGKGKIYSKNKSIAFEGEMKNGLPHGRGKSPGPDGEYYEVNWNEGISSIIEDSPSKPM